MKQTQTLLCMIALAMTIGLASCKKESTSPSQQTQDTANILKCGHPTTPPPNTPPTTCGTPTVVALKTSQNASVGTVTVANDATNLYVTYAVTGSWSLDDLRLFVGDCGTIPVNSQGAPVPSEFSHSTSCPRGRQSYTFTIALSTLGNCFCVAAQANLNSSNRYCNDQIAWGAGTAFVITNNNSGNNNHGGHQTCGNNNNNYCGSSCNSRNNCTNATYFNYCKQTCTPTTCIKTPELLFNGENQWPNGGNGVTVGGYSYNVSTTSTIYYGAPTSDAKNALFLIATLKIYGNTISPPSNVTSAATVVENWLATLGQLTDASNFTAPTNVKNAITTVANWESTQYCAE